MPRAAAGTTLALLGLLVLATTQPWAQGLVEPAPGAVRTRWSATGAELVPWTPAVALAAGASSLVLLARGGDGTPGRILGLLTVLGSVAAAAAAMLVVAGRTAVPPGVLAAGPTGWSWAALLAGAAAAATAVPGVLGAGRRRAARAPSPGRRGPGPAPDPLPAERRRRQDARAWAELDAGRDPTRDPGAGTMAPAAPEQDPRAPAPGADPDAQASR
ncbi:MAG TPA: Trp biosynthesis-associated membrane protein [Ornithinimicrobium sp.]|nr:Trp biosynthesis-associated membrane protein [Ornithinimicrobium sp.]